MYSKKNGIALILYLFALISISAQCNKNGNGSGSNPPPATVNYNAEVWLTNSNQSALFQKQASALAFSSASNSFPMIDVDSAQTFQTIDGFGYTLTGSSAYLIQKMGASERSNLLKELFSSDGIGISYLRVSMGASDLSPSVFTYNDLPAGETDTELTKFSLSKDLEDVVPLLKQVLAINPSIKILASPWTAPTWMKTNGSSIGGSLKPEYYSVYAKYFVKYIEAMKANGITIDAVTIQNEPEHGGNNPSMLMTATEQAGFIKTSLGPAFKAAGLSTKIITWDHNCDKPNYPITVLNDADARQYIDGSAFHLYAGDISALSTVYNAHPDKNLYFTEQWTSATGDFGGDLKWHIKNVIIGSMRNWSKVALEWNLANDPSFGPHTEGGCTECKGALTINGSAYTKNVAYYIIAHASKWVSPGSQRISSTSHSIVPNVAFKRPDGKKVLIVLNDGNNPFSFNIRFKGAWATANLAAGAVGTYIW
ncbi:MAG: glycoside hydrolase family 30 beta sandwich domain-containing protein [Niabella sp.]